MGQLGTDVDLGAQVARLCAIEDIKRVKYAYLRCLDQKDWDGMAELFAPEATAAYSAGKYSFDGRDEIIDFVARNMSRDAFHSSHKVHHPEIDVDGDTARATWALEDTVLDSEWNFILMGSAFYEDEYERRSGRWVITRTTYKRTYEFMVPTTSLEGFALTASWWGTGGGSTVPAS